MFRPLPSDRFCAATNQRSLVRHGSCRWVVNRYFPHSAAAAPHTIRYVSVSGNDWGNGTCAQAAPCRTIKYAIAVAKPGDTVDIANGTYAEANIQISENLVLKGKGVRNTVVTGQGIDSVFVIQANIKVTIKGMRIKKGNASSADRGGGVRNFGDLNVKKR